MAKTDVTTLVVASTLIFLIAPVFLLCYVALSNRRKKRYIQEKEEMRAAFGGEIEKARHEIREQTLQTVGADLHDNIGQLLSLVVLTLKSATSGDPQKAVAKVSSAIDLTSRSIRELRQLGKLLQGDQFAGMGLREAISQELSWVERSGNFRINFESNTLTQINAAKDLILFRVTQESLNNILKHSGADQIDVSLNYAAGQLRLHIADNGVGFNAGQENAATGMGLHNIRKRVALAGGNITITASPHEGTSINILLPYP